MREPGGRSLYERVLVMVRGEELAKDAVGTRMLMNNWYRTYEQLNSKEPTELLTRENARVRLAQPPSAASTDVLLDRTRYSR